MLLPLRVVWAPSTARSPWCWLPVVCTLPPSMARVPAASLCSDVALTAAPNCVAPPALTVMAPSRVLPPTTPPKRASPLPVSRLRAWAPSTVPARLTVPPLLVSARSPARATAPP